MQEVSIMVAYDAHVVDRPSEEDTLTRLVAHSRPLRALRPVVGLFLRQFVLSSSCLFFLTLFLPAPGHLFYSFATVFVDTPNCRFWRLFLAALSLKTEVVQWGEISFHEVDFVDFCVNVWVCVLFFLIASCVWVYTALSDAELVCGCQFFSMYKFGINEDLVSVCACFWVCVWVCFPHMVNKIGSIQWPCFPCDVLLVSSLFQYSNSRAATLCKSISPFHTCSFFLVAYYSVWSQLGTNSIFYAGIQVKNLKEGPVPFPGALSIFNRLKWITVTPLTLNWL